MVCPAALQCRFAKHHSALINLMKELPGNPHVSVSIEGETCRKRLPESIAMPVKHRVSNA